MYWKDVNFRALPLIFFKSDAWNVLNLLYLYFLEGGGSFNFHFFFVCHRTCMSIYLPLYFSPSIYPPILHFIYSSIYLYCSIIKLFSSHCCKIITKKVFFIKIYAKCLNNISYGSIWCFFMHLYGSWNLENSAV